MNEASSITVGRNDLASAVTFAALALSRRPAVPVLEGMTAVISAGTLTLGAFDYDTHASAKVSGSATAPGAILVDGRGLAAAVRALPKGKNVTATLAIGADALVITCDGTETVLAAINASDYPSMPAMPPSSGLADAASFVTSVNRVAPIASTDDTLPVLTHVHVTSDRGEITLAATDRYRLAVDHVGWTGPDGTEVLIPAAILGAFAKKCDRAGKITLAIGDTHAGLSDGTRTVIARTYPLDARGGTFPRWRSLTRGHGDHDTVILADAAALRTAVERAGKLTGRNDRMGFDVAGGRITVTAVRDGQAVGTQRVVATVDGPDAPFGFNAGYLASLLAGFSGTVRIGLKTRTTTDMSGKEHTSQQPAQLTGETFFALCMPVRSDR